MTNIKMHSLAKVLARHHQVTASELIGHSRVRSITLTRFKFCWIARYRLGHSTTAIAKFLGGRDHTTVVHATRQAERLGLICNQTVNDILDEAKDQTVIDINRLKLDAGVFCGNQA